MAKPCEFQETKEEKEDALAMCAKDGFYRAPRRGRRRQTTLLGGTWQPTQPSRGAAERLRAGPTPSPRASHARPRLLLLASSGNMLANVLLKPPRGRTRAQAPRRSAHGGQPKGRRRVAAAAAAAVLATATPQPTRSAHDKPVR
jgi:hypothetical protein